MPQWATFAAFAGVVTVGLLLLSYASQGIVSPDGERPPRDRSGPGRNNARPESGGDDSSSESGSDDISSESSGDDTSSESDAGRSHQKPDTETPLTDAPVGAETNTDVVSASDAPQRAERQYDPDRELVMPKSGVRYRPPPPEETPELSTGTLLVNVAFSQGLFALALLGGAWYTQIPASAFGAGIEAFSVSGLFVGVALGLALYVVNEVGAAVGSAYGLGRSEQLRQLLAPDSNAGWAALLLVILPLIAGFEELLFRGALVGVFAAGFGISPWLLAVISSLAFALGHGAQGRLGVVVTGALGFVLAAGFILTESLFVVVVAHYLVNALEFVVHEALDVDLLS
ncbi:CPBP family intramembrane metalloprotease [Halogeometricum borinquense]|uniref:CPBP family intramembrane metalloprotease n=1 Tax=Halogeometricum borinquense TaxID=60847 RepID=A0A6C0UGL0_9EURY|nr:CPBP family intramembrane glutamic endopeptidase [Halogeometricum borinquense]QIB73401.1 CPBP family intramembrane metalloprotease [Halogeometricum borinquense]